MCVYIYIRVGMRVNAHNCMSIYIYMYNFLLEDIKVFAV